MCVCVCVCVCVFACVCVCVFVVVVFGGVFFVGFFGFGVFFYTQSALRVILFRATTLKVS